MTLYANAVTAIRDHATATAAALDAAAAAARQAHIVALRAACLDGVAEDSPARPVAELLANTIAVGREYNGYPAQHYPDETKAVIIAAAKAGLLECHDHAGKAIPYVNADGVYITVGAVNLYRDASGVSHIGRTSGGQLPERTADYQAWDAAKKYPRAAAESL